MSSVASSISFANFTDLCSKLSQSEKQAKHSILSKYISCWREKGNQLGNQPDGVSFLPVLRFLLPNLDRERGAYGIKENTLAKIYIRILCLPPNGLDAAKLLNYRAPKTAGNEAGDFASVAYWILKKRCAKGGDLSIEDVNNSLNKIAMCHSHHDPRGIDSELVTLLQSTSAEEQKWIIRIILKDMKLGIGQSAIFNAFHTDAKDLYDVTNSLQKVCDQLNDPSKRLHEIELELFSPFRPMLSEEMDVSKVESYFNRTQYFFVETKLDGERFQMHMRDGTFKYFSRNGFDYTDNFGANSGEGTLTQYLSSQISPDVRSIILDGEMMSWNRNKDNYTTKGQDVDVKKLKATNVHRPCFCVFDILHLNGEVLTNKSLIHRLDILEKVISPREGVIALVNRSKVTTKDEIWNALNSAMDNCEEGIVLKEFLAVYKPNVRKGGGWYKIKPEYTEGLMDTLDLVIVGGYHGAGRHKGGISHFLLAVALADGETYQTVAKVSSGIAAAALEELQARLESAWQAHCPPCVEWSKEKPDVWIHPEKSILLEIKASEIIPSNSYKTGHTLRFPRVLKVRYDKPWSQCMTLQEFEDKRLNSSGKLTSHRLSDEDVSPTKKRRIAKSTLDVGAQFRTSDASNIEVVSNLLDGKEICVITGCFDKNKSDVEKLIVSFGGVIVQNPGVNTWCVLSEQETIRVKNIILSKKHDVIKTSWIISVLTSECSDLPPVPRHSLLGMSYSTEARINKKYDAFGDHFTVPATLESLKLCMALAGKIDLPIPSAEEKAELDLELFNGPNVRRIFRKLVVYVDKAEESDFDIRMALFDFILNGGEQEHELNERVTHVIADRNSKSELVLRHRLNFRVVDAEWISSCIKAKKLLDTPIT